MDKPLETAASQASLSWVGKTTGYAVGRFRPNLSPTPSLSPPERSQSDPPVVGWGFRAPKEFPKNAFPLPRLPLASVIRIRKRTTAIKIQNTKQQKPQTEQYPKPHQRSSFPAGPRPAQSGCLGRAPSYSPWSRTAYSLGALVSLTLPSFWATLLGWCE